MGRFENVEFDANKSKIVEICVSVLLICIYFDHKFCGIVNTHMNPARWAHKICGYFHAFVRKMIQLLYFSHKNVFACFLQFLRVRLL